MASATARLGATGVDEECTVVLRHSSGALSTCMASIRAQGPSHLIVSGTVGMIEVEAPLYRPFRARWSRTTPRPGGTSAGDRLVGLRDHPALHWLRQRLPAPPRGKRMFKPYSGLGYHYEAAEVASGIAHGHLESPVMPLDQTIEVLHLIDAARSRFDDAETS